jgi:hypothetical protein
VNLVSATSGESLSIASALVAASPLSHCGIYYLSSAVAETMRACRSTIASSSSHRFLRSTIPSLSTHSPNDIHFPHPLPRVARQVVAPKRLKGLLDVGALVHFGRHAPWSPCEPQPMDRQRAASRSAHTRRSCAEPVWLRPAMSENCRRHHAVDPAVIFIEVPVADSDFHCPSAGQAKRILPARKDQPAYLLVKGTTSERRIALSRARLRLRPSAIRFCQPTRPPMNSRGSAIWARWVSVSFT